MTHEREKYMSNLSLREEAIRDQIDEVKKDLRTAKFMLNVLGEEARPMAIKRIKMAKIILKLLKKQLPLQSALLPCPFCGDTSYGGVHPVIIGSIGYGEETYGVMCENCCAEINQFDTPEEAIEAWNRRA